MPVETVIGHAATGDEAMHMRVVHEFGRITPGESAGPSLLPSYASACVHRQTTLSVL
jgi:hypothetical protein